MGSTKLGEFRDLVKLVIDGLERNPEFTDEELDLVIRNVYFFISGENDPMKRDLIFIDPKTGKELSWGNCFFLINCHYKITITEKQLQTLEYEEKIAREKKFLDFIANFMEFPRMVEFYINILGESGACMWTSKAGFFEYLQSRKSSIVQIIISARFFSSELNKIFHNPLTAALDKFFHGFTFDKCKEYYSNWTFPELSPVLKE